MDLEPAMLDFNSSFVCLSEGWLAVSKPNRNVTTMNFSIFLNFRMNIQIGFYDLLLLIRRAVSLRDSPFLL